MALEFDITLDDLEMQDYERAVAETQDDIDLAVVLGINATTALVAAGLVQAMDKVFDRPNAFTRNAVGTAMAGPDDLSGAVFLKRQQASYLDVQIDGGVRRAGDVGASKTGPIIPGPDAPKDRHGNLPRGYIARVLQEPNVSWARLNGQHQRTLVRRTPHKLEILAIIVDQTDYAPRFDFYGIARNLIATNLARQVAKALVNAVL